MLDFKYGTYVGSIYFGKNKTKYLQKLSGAPGGWSAPLAWGSAVEEDVSLLTQPHPGILHHPPLLQTFRNEGQRYRKVKKKERERESMCDRMRQRGNNRKAAFRSHCSWRHCDTLSILPEKRQTEQCRKE